MLVLLTRPERDNARIKARLDALGVETLCWPLSRIVPTDEVPSLPEETGAVVFTSANGVHAFADLSPRRDLPAICVGPRTAEAARRAGFGEVTETGGTVDHLRAYLAEAPHSHVFYARGRQVSTDLKAALSGSGCTVTEGVVYETRPGPPPESSVRSALASGRIDAVTIWSRRNADVFSDRLGELPAADISGADLVAISENAAQPLVSAGFRNILIAGSPDLDGMVAEIRAALRQLTRNGWS